MIDFISSWAEQIVIAIVVASLIEMILPENNNKKYIKMIIGIFILFNILSPLVKNNELFSIEKFDKEAYVPTEESKEVNQTSMDERLQELYVQELKKNITQKVQESGFDVVDCDVEAVLYGEESNRGIKKIYLNIKMQENSSSVNRIDKVEINVGVNKYVSSKENEDSNISKEEINKLKEILSSYYEVEEKNIKINY